MSEMIPKILRAVGSIVFIGAFVLGIVEWVVWGDRMDSLYIQDFTFWTFLSYVAVGFLVAILLYALAEVLDRLMEISTNCYEICRMMEEDKKEKKAK